MSEACFALLFSLLGASATPAALLAAADAVRHPLQEGSLRMRVVVEEPGKPSTASELVVYVRGEERALLVFEEGKEKGRKVLMLEERVWLLLPGTSRPVPVSAGQRLLGGASIADLGRLSFARDFEGVVREREETLEGVLCRVVDLKARSRKSSYAGGTLWLASKDSLPRRARLRLRSGKDAKELQFSAYARENGKTVLRRMEIRHLLPAERGMLTRIEFLRYEPGKVDDAFFDPVAARGLP